MDPNNNQPIGTNPLQQPTAPQPVAPQPVQSPPPTPVSEAGSAPLSGASAPKKGMGKGIILLVILLLLAVGIIAYILFAGAQMKNNQKTTIDNNSTIAPTATTVPTLAPEEDLEVASPEADLLDLDADLKGL